ncbi:MAG: putative bifunctional diguanylate cyclase/phosphodiesterase [Actinomycetes bacterium]
MGRTSSGPSFPRRSQFCAVWYVTVVAAAVLTASAVVDLRTRTSSLHATFWVVAALAVSGELLPVRTSREVDNQGTLISTAFVFATLYVWGPWPALLLEGVATLFASVLHRRPAWESFFRAGAGMLAVCVSWSTMLLAGVPEGLEVAGQELHGADLLWVVPGWLLWYAADTAVESFVARSEERRLYQTFPADFWYDVVTGAAVLALAPVVAVSLHASVWFLPVLLVPLVVVYQAARLSLDEQHKALHDPLTGLPNRKFLMDRLASATAPRRTAADRTGDPAPPPFVLCLLDLDRFKDVNDTLGHHVGDELLALLARRIQGVLRANDVVARLGGDEFAVYLPAISSSRKAVELATRIREALVEPFSLERVVLEVEASIGIAMYPRHGTAADELMRHADVAMYLAKELQSGVEVYDPEHDFHNTDRLGLLAALRGALDAHQLELHYQPEVSLETGQVVGAEALVRWRHPARGYIPPDEFIPLAETSGLMHRLTAFVIDTALAQVAAWHAEGMVVTVAVNVSSRDLHGPWLARSVSESLARHRVPASLLRLELTERTLMAEHSRVLDTLVALEALDVEISLDDFGTGYSSMFMLKRLPVSEIKVDRSFVSMLAVAGEDASIVRSIIDLAHALGMQAVAEGVETAEVWQQLVDLGCDTAQGWFVSRPMDAVAATAWLRQRLADPDCLPLVAGRDPVR